MGNVLTTGVIFAELLQGARNKNEKAILEQYFAALPHCNENAETWIEAGKLSFELKAPSRGVGLIDLALIVLSRHHNAKFWSKDKKLLALLNKEEIFHAKK